MCKPPIAIEPMIDEPARLARLVAQSLLARARDEAPIAPGLDRQEICAEAPAPGRGGDALFCALNGVAFGEVPFTILCAWEARGLYPGSRARVRLAYRRKARICLQGRKSVSWACINAVSRGQKTGFGGAIV